MGLLQPPALETPSVSSSTTSAPAQSPAEASGGDPNDVFSEAGQGDNAVPDDFGFGGDNFGFGNVDLLGDGGGSRPKAYDNVTLLRDQASANGHPDGNGGEAAVENDRHDGSTAGPKRYDNAVLLGDQHEADQQEADQHGADPQAPKRYENVTLLAESPAENVAVSLTGMSLYDT